MPSLRLAAQVGEKAFNKAKRLGSAGYAAMVASACGVGLSSALPLATVVAARCAPTATLTTSPASTTMTAAAPVVPTTSVASTVIPTAPMSATVPPAHFAPPPIALAALFQGDGCADVKRGEGKRHRLKAQRNAEGEI